MTGVLELLGMLAIVFMLVTIVAVIIGILVLIRLWHSVKKAEDQAQKMIDEMGDTDFTDLMER